MQMILRRIKRFGKTCKALAPLHRQYLRIKKEIIFADQKKLLQSKGDNLIQYLQNTLFGKCFFFFDMGTLLGIVREARILKHDYDIDVAVYIENDADIQKIRRLLSDNCKLKYSFSVDHVGIVEDSYVMDGIKFDICYYRRQVNDDVCYLMRVAPEQLIDDGTRQVICLHCKPILKTEEILFHNMKITIPENAESYLCERYGKNWKVPDKYYVFWEGPSAEITNLIGRCEDYTQIGQERKGCMK